LKALRDSLGRFRRIDIDKDKLLSLYKQGLSLSKIGIILGCSQQTVSRRLRELGAEQRPYVKRRIESLNCAFKAELDNRLAYLIGAITGDGSISPSKVVFYNKDEDFIREFIENAEALKIPVRVYAGKGAKRIVLPSRDLAKYIRTLNIDKIMDDKDLFRFFVRGFYDAEGCFIVQECRGHKYATITISNSDGNLLTKIKEKLLQFFQIHSNLRMTRKRGRIVSKKTKIIARKDIWVLSIYAQRDVLKFITEIGSSIPRKRGEGKEWNKKAFSYVWWSKQEIETLKKLYPNFGSIAVSKVINRTPKAIINKAYKLGVKYVHSRQT